MRRARWCVGVLIAVTAVAAAAAARADSLHAIPLQHRLAEDVIPVLEPLLPAGAAVTGAGDVLLLRADDATLEQVRAALAVIDRAPRQLLITVGQATAAHSRDARVQGSVTVESGDVRVGAGHAPGADSGATVAVRADQQRGDLRSVSSVRALEGHEAYVAVGESRAFTSTSSFEDGRRGRSYAATAQREVQTGFFATPRLRGDLVTLEVSPTQQQFTSGASRPGVSTQALTTTVSGRLGEWIELGGVSDSREGTASGLITWGSRTELTQYSAWVKVEEVR